MSRKTPRKILCSVLMVSVLMVLMLCIACSAAAQTTINFAPLVETGGTAAMGVSFSAFHGVGNSYSQSGFTFTATDNPWGPQTLGLWKTGSPNHPLGGKKATALTAYYAGTRITVTAEGGSFDLISIDLAQWGAGQGGGKGAVPVTFHGLRDGNEVATQTFQVPRVHRSPALSPFRFKGFTNLTSIYAIEEGTFVTGYGFQLNNMVVRSSQGSPGANDRSAAIPAASGSEGLHQGTDLQVAEKSGFFVRRWSRPKVFTFFPKDNVLLPAFFSPLYAFQAHDHLGITPSRATT